jgi:hypothetical protein
MEHCYNVEYCDLELKFNRNHIQELIRKLVENGYSLNWSENQNHFIVSIRATRKGIKLKFMRQDQRFKLIGNYHIRDQIIATILEEMIETTLGHAIVKRFGENQMTIENIVFGERVKLVEIDGVEHRVIYEKKNLVSVGDMLKAFKSDRAEKRIPILRLEMDYELATLFDAMEQGDPCQIQTSKSKLDRMRREMILLEM